MALKDDLPWILGNLEKNDSLICHNSELFDIFEGSLLQYVLKDLQKQLSPASFEMVKHRVAPINVLIRIISKLSKIYQKPPMRTLSKENASDQDLLDWYISTMDVNTQGAISNRFFNLFKNTFLEPFVRDRKPALRVIPSDRFTVLSTDRVDPTRPTHYIKYMGKMNRRVNQYSTEETQVYYIYTDGEFLPVDSKGRVIKEILTESGNPEGINPYGKIPGVYINRSRHKLIPLVDTDTLKMTKLFPVLLSDLNFAVMFQAFSIIWGIDVTDENLSMSPNAFWRFTSDPTKSTKPEIGVIKPQVDIDQVINLIMAQLAFWLQSRNIRPGSVGQVNSENLASGVSKVVDEMDTYEDRQDQVPYFKTAETELWDLIIKHMHPVWVKEGEIDERRNFAPGQSVVVEFHEQQPMVNRSELLTEIAQELKLGLATRKDAIKRLNPDLDDNQVDIYLAEIEAERTVEIPSTEDDPAAPEADQVIQ